MKLVQISLNDRMGERFNGLAIRPQLASAGVDSTHLVWNRTVEDPHVRALLPYPGVRALNDFAVLAEDRLSLQATLQAHSFALAAQPEFRTADLAHYHIIQDGFFSLQALPFLTRRKPSVWTWHGPLAAHRPLRAPQGLRALEGRLRRLPGPRPHLPPAPRSHGAERAAEEGRLRTAPRST